MKIFGILLGILSLYFLYLALISSGPNANDFYNAGFNIGKHLPWIICGGGAYFLLKKS